MAADDVAAACGRCVCAFDLNARPAEDFHHAGGVHGDEMWVVPATRRPS